MKTVKFNFLERSGPFQACNETALALPLYSTAYRNLWHEYFSSHNESSGYNSDVGPSENEAANNHRNFVYVWRRIS